jgi:ubiquinone/menaquinone biosynthesis C-methylase UbiE
MVRPIGKGADYRQEQKKFFNEYTQLQVDKAPESADVFQRFFKYMDTRKVRYSEEALENLVTNMKGNKLLEVGCGTGPLTQIMAILREDVHIIALDMSLENMKTVREVINKRAEVKAKVSYVVGDGEALPFRPDVFDAATAVMVLHHTYSPAELLREMSNTIKSGSNIVIVELTSDNPIVDISRKVFGLAPRYFRNLFSLDADVINEAGEVALITHFSTDSLKKYVREADLNIIREERHVLALFTLDALSRIVPFMSKVFDEQRLMWLYEMEKRLLKNTFLRRFGGAVSLWVTKN